MQDYKRDSEAHAARRASLKDQTAAPSGGVLANMWNRYVVSLESCSNLQSVKLMDACSTFKGDKK